MGKSQFNFDQGIIKSKCLLWGCVISLCISCQPYASYWKILQFLKKSGYEVRVKWISWYAVQTKSCVGGAKVKDCI